MLSSFFNGDSQSLDAIVGMDREASPADYGALHDSSDIAIYP